MSTSASSDTGRALRTLARVFHAIGEYGEAERTARDALQLSRAYGGRVDAGWDAAISGNVATATGRYVEARACFAESLTIAKEAGNHWMLTDSLHGLGGLALICGDLDEAQQLYEESRASFERLGIEGTPGYAGRSSVSVTWQRPQAIWPMRKSGSKRRWLRGPARPGKRWRDRWDGAGRSRRR